MLHTAPPASVDRLLFIPQVIAIRHDDHGFGIRFGLTEAEDEILKGPVFETLHEALIWIDEIDRLRAAA